MKPIKGRGSAHNPENRFLDTHLEYDINEKTGKGVKSDTQLLTDHTSEIISTNRSPDISFDVSLNPYRGCEHGCVYCYARPTHEYLGMSAGLDFESKIVVKYNAPKLLRDKLAQESWKPQTLIMSGVTDPYQPIKRELKITRRCIEVLAESNHPLVIITKNYQVTRDIDLLSSLAEKNAVKIVLSITSLDKRLTDTMEPRTSRPNRRLKAVRELSDAGIPVHVNIAPLIPGLTVEELVPIMEASAEFGAGSVAVVPLRLPYAVKDLFVKWLDDHHPERKNKVINRIKNTKEGKLNRAEWGERFKVDGPYGEQIRQLLKIHTKRLGLNQNIKPLETKHFRRPETDQLRLF